MKIRYDFWSLVVALKSGLTHGKATAADRAKVIVDGLAALTPAERHERTDQLGVTLEYLQAIEAEIANRQVDANSETRTFPPVSPSDTAGL